MDRTLDMDPKLYRGLWTLSLVLAEIAREVGEKKAGHNMSCPYPGSQVHVKRVMDRTSLKCSLN
jgi:hypothetical protein